MENNLIVGIGEVLWDILPEGKKLGGAPCNFAYHVGQFGLNSCAVSAVGGDELGRAIIENLDSKHIKHHIATVAYPTGTVNVEIDANGVPQYEIRQDVAWDNIPYTAELERLAAHTRVVCFGSLARRSAVSRTTIERFLDAMPTDEGRLVVFDVNLRQDFYTRATLADSLERCNVLKINDEELVIVSRLFGLPGIDLDETCRTILKRYNLEILILTCGVNGSYVFTPQGVSFRPTPKVEVADTVGAGDSFTASFIASILLGRSIEEAHRKAVEVSAYVCTCHGAMPSLPARLTAEYPADSAKTESK